MSPKRRKLPSPANLPVEAIIWRDAFVSTRGKLDTAPVLQHTVGFTVHEDDDQVILAHEIKSTEDWITEDMDFTAILKQTIIQRTKLIDVAVQREDDLDFVLTEQFLTPKPSQVSNGPQAA